MHIIALNVSGHGRVTASGGSGGAVSSDAFLPAALKCGGVGAGGYVTVSLGTEQWPGFVAAAGAALPGCLGVGSPGVVAAMALNSVWVDLPNGGSAAPGLAVAVSISPTSGSHAVATAALATPAVVTAKPVSSLLMAVTSRAALPAGTAVQKGFNVITSASAEAGAFNNVSDAGATDVAAIPGAGGAVTVTSAASREVVPPNQPPTTPDVQTANPDFSNSLAAGSAQLEVDHVVPPSPAAANVRFILLTTTLPMAASAFQLVQAEYISSVAATAGVPAGDVTILNIQQSLARRSGRMLLASAVEVDASISLSDNAAAAAATASAVGDVAQLDTNLAAYGLPPITPPISVTLVNGSAATATPAPKAGSQSPGSGMPVAAVAAAGVVGGCGALLLAAFLVVQHRRRIRKTELGQGAVGRGEGVGTAADAFIVYGNEVSQVLANVYCSRQLTTQL